MEPKPKMNRLSRIMELEKCKFLSRNEMNKMDIDDSYIRVPILWGLVIDVVDVTVYVYRADAQKLEEWARTQTANTLVDFSSKDGEIENIFKDIAQRAGTKDGFCYSRLFAVGLFRLLELANVTDPTILEKVYIITFFIVYFVFYKNFLFVYVYLDYLNHLENTTSSMLCAALNVNKKSVDRDLDVYRNLLSKLVQAKELLKEYVEREKKKRGERETQKANETVTKCLGDYQYAGR
ncbi:hypothetical protein MTR67_032535 [Solanum verrucosum]|uniref:Uncharacterized protein n=1 Tax=Solanum verrucosum TaxID=315347 RepID=A0AAF0U4N3_SOLVR|nr:hypothetical protein MTR67_032535 [Solanum verrucosum]